MAGGETPPLPRRNQNLAVRRCVRTTPSLPPWGRGTTVVVDEVIEIYTAQTADTSSVLPYGNPPSPTGEGLRRKRILRGLAVCSLFLCVTLSGVQRSRNPSRARIKGRVRPLGSRTVVLPLFAPPRFRFAPSPAAQVRLAVLAQNDTVGRSVRAHKENAKTSRRGVLFAPHIVRRGGVTPPENERIPRRKKREINSRHKFNIQV